jgi:general stress protein 26
MGDSRMDSIKKLNELTEKIDFCMLTTVDSGCLRSRPMSTQQFEENGEIWFFIDEQSHKVDELTNDNRVNLSYAKPDESTYVSVSGRAEVVRDKAKMKELWNPILKAWFPDGLDDPNLTLLNVEVEQAEYWETTSGKIVQLFGFVKSLATGQQADWGENSKIDL